MQNIRKLGESKPEVKDEWASSDEPFQQIVESRFHRLSLKGEQVDVRPRVGEEEIDLLSRHANNLFPDLCLTKLQKIHTRKKMSYAS